MRILPVAVVCLVLGACAQGQSAGDDDDDDVVVDAPRIDGAPGDGPDPDAPPIEIDAAAIDAAAIDAAAIDAAAIDAAAIDGTPPIDATPIDAGIDAPCTTTTQQLLINPAYDGAPLGTGWVDQPFDPGFPIITPDDGVPEHTAPNKAWMGGWLGDIFGGDATDLMYQQVTIPAGTTSLVVRGQYQVVTGETAGSTVYDDSIVDLVNPSNGLLESVLTISNVGPTTAWTPFQRVFTATYAGQVVRLRFRSANDFSNETSFYYDSLVLEATVACP